jgi:hypothetical protein
MCCDRSLCVSVVRPNCLESALAICCGCVCNDFLDSYGLLCHQQRLNNRNCIDDNNLSLANLRQHFPPILLQRPLLLPTHQINIELRHAHVGQRAQLLDVRFGRAN